MADQIPSWTSDVERECLRKLSMEVPAGGTILEIGALYGGTTAVLAGDRPDVLVTSMDNFSWRPEGYPPVSKDFMLKNLAKLGITNVEVIEGDSRVLKEDWKNAVDLCFIDGGHSFEFVYSDLCGFAPHSEVVALHDYGNPFWPSIQQAVELFLADNNSWFIDEIFDTIVVLRRT